MASVMTLWRAVGAKSQPHILDILVPSSPQHKGSQSSCARCSKAFTYVPRVTITDKFKRYGAAKREILPGVEHRQRCSSQ